MFGIVYNSGCA